MFANHVEAEDVSQPRADTRNWADALWRASAGTVAKATQAATAAIWPGAWAPVGTARPVNTMRRYSTVRVPIAAVDDVCRKFGVTANDVALAAITEGFRTVLLHRGEQPRADSLRTLEKIDERVSAMLPYLPVEHERPGSATADGAQPVEARTERQRNSGSIVDISDQLHANRVVRQGASSC